jgi:ankyrin repeat protein
MSNCSKILKFIVDNFDHENIDDGFKSILLNLIRNPKVNINYQNEDGKTILMLLARYAKTSQFETIIEELLKRDDIDVNLQQNKDGWTALMIACRSSNTHSTERTVEFIYKLINWVKRKKKTIMSRFRARKAIGLGM